MGRSSTSSSGWQHRRIDEERWPSTTHCELDDLASKMMAGVRPATIQRIVPIAVCLGQRLHISPTALIAMPIRRLRGRTSDRSRQHSQDSDCERERQFDLVRHCHSPCVEAGSGFHGLDRAKRPLFPRWHSKGASRGARSARRMMTALPAVSVATALFVTG
jgi:hypothetical protein